MWDFFFPCIFWVSQNFHICTQLPGVLGRKRKELERKFSFLLLPFTGCAQMDLGSGSLVSSLDSALKSPRPVPHPPKNNYRIKFV